MTRRSNPCQANHSSSFEVPAWLRSMAIETLTPRSLARSRASAIGREKKLNIAMSMDIRVALIARMRARSMPAFGENIWRGKLSLLNEIGVSVSYPLPGTKFHERVRAELGTKQNWLDSEDLSLMFQGAYTTEFYRALRDALHAEVETWSRKARRESASGAEAWQAADVGAARVGALWQRVEELERTCRNGEPAMVPLLACSDAV